MIYIAKKLERLSLLLSLIIFTQQLKDWDKQNSPWKAPNIVLMCPHCSHGCGRVSSRHRDGDRQQLWEEQWRLLSSLWAHHQRPALFLQPRLPAGPRQEDVCG